MSCQNYDYYGKYDLKDFKIRYHGYYGHTYHGYYGTDYYRFQDQIYLIVRHNCLASIYVWMQL